MSRLQMLWNQLLHISSLSFPFGHGHYRKLQNWRASEYSWNFECVIKAFTNYSGQSSNCQKIKPALVRRHQPFNEVLENFSEALLEISIMLEVDCFATQHCYASFALLGQCAQCVVMWTTVSFPPSLLKAAANEVEEGNEWILHDTVCNRRCY